MEEPIRVVVWARRETGGVPEMGARDQYMPDAGAGWTSGAVLGSGREGKAVYGLCWAGIREGVVVRVCAGEEILDWEDLGAIAEVDRRFIGRGVVGLMMLRVGVEAEGSVVRLLGGEVRSCLEVSLPCSGLGVSLPWGLEEDFGDEESF